MIYPTLLYVLSVAKGIIESKAFTQTRSWSSQEFLSEDLGDTKPGTLMVIILPEWWLRIAPKNIEFLSNAAPPRSNKNLKLEPWSIFC